MKHDGKAYFDGFRMAPWVIEPDPLTLEEILGPMDPDREADPWLIPWKRVYRAAIRKALGH
jgi:hypothetical protein